MPIEKGSTRIYFPKVKEAREYLLEKAKAMVELQEKLILEAASKGQYEAALKANQWLIEHTPQDEEGGRSIGTSASKPKEITSGATGPTIQIGIRFGGIDKPKELEAPATVEVIDITPDPPKD